MQSILHFALITSDQCEILGSILISMQNQAVESWTIWLHSMLHLINAIFPTFQSPINQIYKDVIYSALTNGTSSIPSKQHVVMKLSLNPAQRVREGPLHFCVHMLGKGRCAVLNYAPALDWGPWYWDSLTLGVPACNHGILHQWARRVGQRLRYHKAISKIIIQ